MNGAQVFGAALVSLALAQLEPIVARQNYISPELSIELEGVCRVTDEAVACWKPDGTSHPVLEKRMDASFQHKNRLVITFGKKTRYAVFRVSGTSRVFPPVDGSFRLNDESYRPYGHYDLAAVRIITDPSEVRGEVRTTLYGPSRESLLELKPGSHVKLPHGTLRFVRSEATKLDVALYGIEAGPRWLIHCAYEGTTMSGTQVSAVDHDGVRIQALDLKGKPVVVDPQLLNEFWRSPGPDTIAAKPRFMQARVTQSGDQGWSYPLRPGDNVFATNIDPSVIGGLRFQHSESQPLTITDIPLDPK